MEGDSGSIASLTLADPANNYFRLIEIWRLRQISICGLNCRRRGNSRFTYSVPYQWGRSMGKCFEVLDAQQLVGDTARTGSDSQAKHWTQWTGKIQYFVLLSRASSKFNQVSTAASARTWASVLTQDKLLKAIIRNPDYVCLIDQRRPGIRKQSPDGGYVGPHAVRLISIWLAKRIKSKRFLSNCVDEARFHCQCYNLLNNKSVFSLKLKDYIWFLVITIRDVQSESKIQLPDCGELFTIGKVDAILSHYRNCLTETTDTSPRALSWGIEEPHHRQLLDMEQRQSVSEILKSLQWIWICSKSKLSAVPYLNISIKCRKATFI